MHRASTRKQTSHTVGSLPNHIKNVSISNQIPTVSEGLIEATPQNQDKYLRNYNKSFRSQSTFVLVTTPETSPMNRTDSILTKGPNPAYVSLFRILWKSMVSNKQIWAFRKIANQVLQKKNNTKAARNLTALLKLLVERRINFGLRKLVKQSQKRLPHLQFPQKAIEKKTSVRLSRNPSSPSNFMAFRNDPRLGSEQTISSVLDLEEQEKLMVLSVEARQAIMKMQRFDRFVYPDESEKTLKGPIENELRRLEKIKNQNKCMRDKYYDNELTVTCLYNHMKNLYELQRDLKEVDDLKAEIQDLQKKITDTNIQKQKEVKQTVASTKAKAQEDEVKIKENQKFLETVVANLNDCMNKGNWEKCRKFMSALATKYQSSQKDLLDLIATLVSKVGESMASNQADLYMQNLKKVMEEQDTLDKSIISLNKQKKLLEKAVSEAKTEGAKETLETIIAACQFIKGLYSRIKEPGESTPTSQRASTKSVVVQERYDTPKKQSQNSQKASSQFKMDDLNRLLYLLEQALAKKQIQGSYAELARLKKQHLDSKKKYNNTILPCVQKIDCLVKIILQQENESKKVEQDQQKNEAVRAKEFANIVSMDKNFSSLVLIDTEGADLDELQINKMRKAIQQTQEKISKFPRFSPCADLYSFYSELVNGQSKLTQILENQIREIKLLRAKTGDDSLRKNGEVLRSFRGKTMTLQQQVAQLSYDLEQSLRELEMIKAENETLKKELDQLKGDGKGKLRRLKSQNEKSMRDSKLLDESFDEKSEKKNDSRTTVRNSVNKNTELKQLQEESGKVKNENKTLKTKVSGLLQQIKEAEEEKARLEAQLNEAAVKYKQNEEEKVKIEHRMKEVAHQYEEEKAQLELQTKEVARKSQEEKTRLQLRIKELSDQTKQVEEEKVKKLELQKQQILKSSKQEIDGLKSRLSLLQETQFRAKETASQNQQDKVKLQLRLKEVMNESEQERAKLQLWIMEMEKASKLEIDALNSQLSSFQVTCLQQHQTQISRLQIQLESLRSSLESKNQVCTKFNRQIEQLQKVLQKRNGKITPTPEQQEVDNTAELAQKIRSYQNKLADLELEKGRLIQTIQTNEATFNKVVKHNQFLFHENNHLKTLVNKLQGATTDRENCLFEEVGEIRNYQCLTERELIGKKDLMELYKEMKTKEQILKNEKHTLEGELKRSSNIIKNLEEELGQQKQTIIVMAYNENRLKEEIQALEQKVTRPRGHSISTPIPLADHQRIMQEKETAFKSMKNQFQEKIIELENRNRELQNREMVAASQKSRVMHLETMMNKLSTEKESALLKLGEAEAKINYVQLLLEQKTDQLQHIQNSPTSPHILQGRIAVLKDEKIAYLERVDKLQQLLHQKEIEIIKGYAMREDSMRQLAIQNKKLQKQLRTINEKLLTGSQNFINGTQSFMSTPQNQNLTNSQFNHFREKNVRKSRFSETEQWDTGEEHINQEDKYSYKSQRKYSEPAEDEQYYIKMEADRMNNQLRRLVRSNERLNSKIKCMGTKCTSPTVGDSRVLTHHQLSDNYDLDERVQYLQRERYNLRQRINILSMFTSIDCPEHAFVHNMNRILLNMVSFLSESEENIQNEVDFAAFFEDIRILVGQGHYERYFMIVQQFLKDLFLRTLEVKNDIMTQQVSHIQAMKNQITCSNGYYSGCEEDNDYGCLGINSTIKKPRNSTMTGLSESRCQKNGEILALQHLFKLYLRRRTPDVLNEIGQILNVNCQQV